ncbi:SusD/RagB family nutrient-binding outer membrane lipoprotein [Panacibacter ginsenosidivorans]|uniref:SusD/RagB family nutrient-binding outer membrane lipoprotein n=1 Tax=Panacibacter ginsenosidivorans TaxID=1813871 RepID=A0A5B8V6S3_9BACT|nr:SusD/RagB family nutrient-binding outer membrane lipoprotein [Panacibacter ginsenosidivorans]QEC67124.1 SusD/RagB family nutrient-binding outer membrane lipoprotein [Panacibacter ginsenosidivorans]
MKKYSGILVVAVMAATLMTSCKKSFDELYQNPNKPTSVPSSLLMNGILNDLYDGPAGMYERWSQYYCINYDYYGNNRYDFESGADYYATLKNVIKMEQEAQNAGLATVNPYSAMAKFFKAYFFTKMSLEMGDIPMTQALQGLDNLTPSYDAQKDVFKQSFAWLDSANTELASLIEAGESISGDIYFGNDLSKWQKTVNTFRLRLLIELSKKADDADLNIKSQFAAITGDPVKYPVMESAEDNLQFIYTHPTNDYPNSPDSYGFDGLRYNMSSTYLGLLTAFKDPRVFIVSEPATALVDAGTSPTSFDAFVGANPGEDLGIMFNKAGNGQYSQLNRWRYYQTYTAEPSVQIGYAEMCFNIAEAINRGWISSGKLGGAEDYYKAGIKASMAFYDIPENGDMTTHVYESGSPGGADVKYSTYTVSVNFDNYYAQPLIKYASGETGLKQILQQRYLALFRHSGLESYYAWRRTGVPTFTTGPGTGNSSRIALRFQYPYDERTSNATNYESALQNQYGGNDDINAQMWLIK